MNHPLVQQPTLLRLVLIFAALILLPNHLHAQSAILQPTETPTQAAPAPEDPPTQIERPFLWKIELASGAPQYLLGTIHVPDERVLKLHPEIEKALAGADILFVELAPADQAVQLQALTLPPGQSTSTTLGEKLTQRIDAQLDNLRQGLTHRALPAFRIWAWPLILPHLEAQLSNEQREVLDLKLVTDALERGVTVRSLEDPRTQLAGFDQLERDEQMRFLEASLDAMEEEDRTDENAMERLVDLYLQGDDKALEQEFRDEFFDGSLPTPLAERIFAAIMTSRNTAMVETIDQTLRRTPDKSHVFAAGAGHFVVEPSVVAGLQKLGYRITRVQGTPTAR